MLRDNKLPTVDVEKEAKLKEETKEHNLIIQLREIETGLINLITEAPADVRTAFSMHKADKFVLKAERELIKSLETKKLTSTEEEKLKALIEIKNSIRDLFTKPSKQLNSKQYSVYLGKLLEEFDKVFFEIWPKTTAVYGKTPVLKDTAPPLALKYRTEVRTLVDSIQSFAKLDLASTQQDILNSDKAQCVKLLNWIEGNIESIKTNLVREETARTSFESANETLSNIEISKLKQSQQTIKKTTEEVIKKQQDKFKSVEARVAIFKAERRDFQSKAYEENRKFHDLRLALHGEFQGIKRELSIYLDIKGNLLDNVNTNTLIDLEKRLVDFKKSVDDLEIALKAKIAARAVRVASLNDSAKKQEMEEECKRILKELTEERKKLRQEIKKFYDPKKKYIKTIRDTKGTVGPSKCCY